MKNLLLSSYYLFKFIAIISCYFTFASYFTFPLITSQTTTNINYYTLTSFEKNVTGFTGILTCNLKEECNSTQVKELSISITYSTTDTLHVRIANTNGSEYEVPVEIMSLDYKESPTHDYTVELSSANTSEPFSLMIKRSSSDTPIFNLSYLSYSIGHSGLKSLSMSADESYTTLTSGLAERISHYNLQTLGSQTYSLYNRPNDDVNLVESSSSHPFIHRYDTSGNISETLFRHSGAQSWEFQRANSSIEAQWIWTGVGGIVDFYVLMGPSPLSIATQHSKIVGFPLMPPVWSLGYHQSRWGYKTALDVQEVVNQYNSHGIPLDSIWSDVDYMDRYIDLTFDPTRYDLTDMNSLLQTISNSEARYILNFNPAVPALLSFNNSNAAPYTPYTSAKELNLFIRHPDNVTALYTYTRPNVTVGIIDYSNPDASDWLSKALNYSLGSLSVSGIDGLWLTENEVTTQCNGYYTTSCNHSMSGPEYSLTPYDFSADVDPDAGPVHTDSVDPIDPPTINPTHYPLDFASINISAYSAIGREIDVHNLYSWYQARTAYITISNNLQQRPMIVSQSTFLGSGQYAVRAISHNKATWEDLVNSIPQVMNMGISGIWSGADLCGYYGNTTEELCSRWHQLGIFYPIVHNHNHYDAKSQEVYTFDEPYLSIMKTSINIRYSLLPYLYTMHSEGHLAGTPFFRSLTWDFPALKEVYGIETQFMAGPIFMVMPILNQGDVNVTAYVPAGVWYDFNTHQQIVSSGESMTFQSDLINPNSTAPILIAAHHVLARQYPGRSMISTHSNPYFYTITVDKSYSSGGHNILDDGIGLKNIDLGNYYSVSSSAQFAEANDIFTGTISILTTKTYPPFNVSRYFIREIFVLGLVGIKTVPSTWLSYNDSSPIDITSFVSIEGPDLVIRDNKCLIGQGNPGCSLMPYTANMRFTFKARTETNGTSSSSSSTGSDHYSSSSASLSPSSDTALSSSSESLPEISSIPAYTAPSSAFYTSTSSSSTADFDTPVQHSVVPFVVGAVLMFFVIIGLVLWRVKTAMSSGYHVRKIKAVDLTNDDDMRTRLT